MNAIIEVSSSNYGSGFIVHNWNLKVTDKGREKSFYLGQDAKFCSRVLGMTGRQVAEEIGSSDLTIEKTRYRLARFIIDTLELTEEQLFELQPWELCCQ